MRLQSVSVRPSLEPVVDNPGSYVAGHDCTASPHLDQHPRLGQRRDDLPVEQLVLQLPVEALDVPVHLRTARPDEQRADLRSGQPPSGRLGQGSRGPQPISATENPAC